MKLTIEKHVLEPVLARAASIVEKRGTIPIIQHVRLIAKEGSLEIRSTDLDIESIETVPCEVSEPGDVTVPAYTLFDIARNAKPGASIVFASGEDDGRVHVTTGRSRFKLPVLPAGDFPEFKVQPAITDIKVPAASFLAALDHVAFAASTDAARYVLCATYLHGKDGKLRAVTTNTHVLALREFEQAGADSLSALIPTKTANELRRRLNGAEGDLSLVTGEGQITVSHGAWLLRSKVIDGSFPDYERVIPKGNPHRLTADGDELRHAIRTAAMVTNEKTRIVRVALAGDSLEITARGDAEACGAMDIEYDGPEMNIGLNADYLLSSLDALDCDVLEVEAPKDHNGPFVLHRRDTRDALVVLMPTRA